MDSELVIILAAVNATISFFFAFGVSRHAASWHWPPSWLRVVANWLGFKTVFFTVSIVGCWALGIIDFTHDSRWHALDGNWGTALYTVPLLFLVLAQAVAVFYWLTGRAVTADVMPDHTHEGPS